MATLQENIRQVNSDFQAIKAKIVEKGVEVAGGTRTAEYASKIDEVYEAGRKSVGEVLKFTDVSSTACRSIVPNGVEPFARVNEIGGMTYKSKNLFEYPYADTTLTSAGITFTDNGDGSITINGTNDGQYNSAFYLYKTNKRLQLPAGIYSAALEGRIDEIEVVYYDGTTYATMTHRPIDINQTTSYIVYIQIPRGATTVYNNVTIYPMLNEGTTALPYEPYFAGLRSASVGELKSEGANLAHSLSAGANTTITDGVVTQIRADTYNTIYLKALLYKGSKLQSSSVVESLYETGVHSVNFNKKGAENRLVFGINGSAFDTTINIDITDLPIGEYTISANFTNITQGSISWKDTMLNIGSTALPYKPYVGTLDTLAIPEAVKSLDGYGLGLNTEYYNYIDFERRVFVQKIKKVVFTGDETLRQYGNYNNCVRFIGKWFDDGRQESQLILCTHFKWGILEPNCVSVGSGNERGSFWIDPRFFTTETTNAEYEATFKAWLKEQYNNGNPVTVVYDLETPIETDISAYLTDEYIEVEGGGTISAVNEYGYDAPTNTSYLIDTQGG